MSVNAIATVPHEPLVRVVPELGNGDVRKGFVWVLGTEHLECAGQLLEQLFALWVSHQAFGLVTGEPFVISPVVPRNPGEELRTLDGLEAVRRRSSVVAVDPVVEFRKEVLGPNPWFCICSSPRST